MTKDLLAAGSDHYKHARIQPLQFIVANGLGYCEGTVIKYVTRYQHSGTPRSDLEKAIHYLQVLLDQCPPDETSPEERRAAQHTPPPLHPWRP